MALTDATKTDTGTVIAMGRFKSGQSLSPLHQAEAYWSALRCGGDVPLRSQIDPRGLQSVLAHVFVLQRIAPGLARFRLAGRHLNDLAGMEVRGMPLSALFSAQARDGLAEVLKAVFDTPAIGDLSLGDGARGAGGEARVLLLPLRGDTDEIDRALGVFLADPETGPAPRRFDLTQSRLRPVSGPPTATACPAPQPGLAEPQGGDPARRSHLRLIRTSTDQARGRS